MNKEGVRRQIAPATPIIVITGPPASGKSTLAQRIAGDLHLPLIAKDPIKETLFDAFGTKDRNWSQWLGQATYPVMQHFIEVQLQARRPVVIEATSARRSLTVSFMS